MNLTPEALVNFTQQEQPFMQRRELEHLGIPYKVRRDGTLIVLAVHVEGMHHQQPEARPRVRLQNASA
jgi:hypothetical protein